MEGEDNTKHWPQTKKWKKTSQFLYKQAKWESFNNDKKTIYSLSMDTVFVQASPY